MTNRIGIIMGVITGHRAWNEGLIAGGVLNSIQPASVDVRLAEKLLIPVAYKTVDPLYGVRYEAAFLSDIDSYIIKPGEFILASTIERVELSETVVATFEGKSSLGRLGLGTHVTAGFIDPGFRGTITIELHNVAPYGIVLRKGMAIGQICFQRMEEPAIPYGSHYGSNYQGQDGPVGYRVGSKRLITEEDEARPLFDFVNGAA